MDQGGWSWTNPEAPPVEQPSGGPTRGQVGMVAAVTLVIGAALLAATILGGSGGGDLNPIAQAAQKTASYPGERMSISGSYVFPGVAEPVQMHGGGALNGDTQQGRLSLTVDATAATPAVEMNELIDGTTFYLSSPELTGQLPDGKILMKIDADSLGGGDSTTSQSDPSEQLKLLEGVSDSYSVVGKESIRGHETTHYSAQVSFQKEADQLRADGNDDAADAVEELAARTGTGFPVEIWIDSKSLVRRASLSIPIPSENGQNFTMNMSMDFFDFGAAPRIILPPESQVYDAGEQLKQLKQLQDLTS